MSPRLGIIGGSGLSGWARLDTPEQREVDTPHGPPSSPLALGDRVAVLIRHGADHRIPPHRVNHKANLWALRKAEVAGVVGTCSAGSLREEIAPGTLVVPDDYVSFWEIPTYFDDVVRHVTPAFDPELRSRLVRAAQDSGVSVRDGGVYVQTRGPRLETRAEVRVLRGFGDLVGMTMAAEATLAQELGLPYASLCSVDNYGHGVGEVPPTFEEIRRTQEVHGKVVREVLVRLVEATG